MPSLVNMLKINDGMNSVSISDGFTNEDNTMELVGYSGNYGAYFRVFGDGNYETTTFPAPEGKNWFCKP